MKDKAGQLSGQTAQSLKDFYFLLSIFTFYIYQQNTVKTMDLV